MTRRASSDFFRGKESEQQPGKIWPKSEFDGGCHIVHMRDMCISQGQPTRQTEQDLGNETDTSTS